MNHRTKEELIAFETRIKELWEAGELPYLIHLCGGNEDVLIRLFENVVREGDWIFSGHRSHYHYLLAGGDPVKLEEMIRRGDSMFVFDKALNFFTSSVLGGTAAIAAGVALQIEMESKDDEEWRWRLRQTERPMPPRRPHVWCFLGDGAEEQGHFYEAVMMVEGHNLPCTFIIEDNDRSVDTDVPSRRGKRVPVVWPQCVRRYHYTPTYPHAGSGCAHKIIFNPAIKPQAYL